jgi:hypothetical protein
LADVPEEWRDLCAAIDTDALPVTLAAEQSVAFSTLSGAARVVGTRRDYSKATEHEICGTADVVGVDGDTIYVGDYKTGWGDVTEPASNPQVRFLAMAFARSFGCSAAVVEVIRIREDGTPWRVRAELDALELDLIADEMRALPRLLVASEPTISEGAHCKYCPAQLHCPAKTQLVRIMATGEVGDWLQPTSPMTAEMAGLAWSRIKAAKAIVAQVERACHAALDQLGELPLPGGRRLRKVLAEGNEQLDGDEVYTAALQLHGAGVAQKCVTLGATKKRIGEAMREAYGRGGAAKERELLDVVRQRGGAVRPMREKVEEVEP